MDAIFDQACRTRSGQTAYFRQLKPDEQPEIFGARFLFLGHIGPLNQAGPPAYEMWLRGGRYRQDLLPHHHDLLIQ